MKLPSLRVAGVEVRVVTRTPGEGVRLRSLLLRLFDGSESARGGDGPAVSLDFDGCPAPPGDSPADALFAAHALQVYRMGERFALRCGPSRLDVDPARDRATGFLDASFWDMPPQCQRVFLFFPLLVLFPRCGLHGIHACALEKDGIGCLAAGNSRQGKTTLTLALVRAGWNYLSDDTVMLCADAGGVEARSFRRGFTCDRDLIERFPELLAATDPVDWADGKVMLDIDAIYAGRRQSRCRPQVLLFPEVTAEPSSRLTPLSAQDSFARLVRHSPFVYTTRSAVAEHLEILRALVAGASRYCLQAGADVYRDPARLSALICGAGRAHDAQIGS